MKCSALVIALALAAPVVLAGPRAPAARAEFVKANPCPATGKARGSCLGWEVDHVVPLKCDGPDTPANMQWLTVEEHKRKTANEAKSCRATRGPGSAAAQ